MDITFITGKNAAIIVQLNLTVPHGVFVILLDG